MTNTQTPKEALVEIEAGFAKSIAALEACLTSDQYVVAWNNGLGVKFADGVAKQVVGVAYATRFSCPIKLDSVVKNGKDEVARVRRLSEIARHDLENVKRAREACREYVAKHGVA